MKVTFVYTDYNPFKNNINKFNVGLALLSAYLKQAGHQTSLIHISDYINRADFLDKVQEKKPDLIAFSFITNMWFQVKKFTSWLKELDLPSIHGGVHTTLFPEEVINFDGVQMLCRGEGEEALVELCNRLEAGSDIQDIKNLWIKDKNGEIIKNPIRPLIEDLDYLPMPDYKLFNYPELEDAKVMKRLVVMASRGCPYQCTYCCNHFIKTLYPNQRKYVRFKSVDKLISEIKQGLNEYPFLKEVRFFDDTLSLHKKWFSEFVDKYAKEINLPYSCNDRPNQIDSSIAEGFKKSGCYEVELGIESGNEYIRNEVMKRKVSDQHIINAYKLLRNSNIKTTAFNVLGVPFETMPTLLDTVKLNAQANPDNFINAYFFPFKRTDLYNICQEKGYLTEKEVSSFFENPVLNLDTVSDSKIIFAFKYFTILFILYKAYLRLPNYLGKKLIFITDKILCWRWFPHQFFYKILDQIKGYPPAFKLVRFGWKKIKGLV